MERRMASASVSVLTNASVGGDAEEAEGVEGAERIKGRRRGGREMEGGMGWWRTWRSHSRRRERRKLDEDGASDGTSDVDPDEVETMASWAEEMALHSDWEKKGAMAGFLRKL